MYIFVQIHICGFEFCLFIPKCDTALSPLIATGLGLAFTLQWKPNTISRDCVRSAQAPDPHITRACGKQIFKTYDGSSDTTAPSSSSWACLYHGSFASTGSFSTEQTEACEKRKHAVARLRVPASPLLPSMPVTCLCLHPQGGWARSRKREEGERERGKETPSSPGLLLLRGYTAR